MELTKFGKGLVGVVIAWVFMYLFLAFVTWDFVWMEAIPLIPVIWRVFVGVFMLIWLMIGYIAGQEEL